MDTSYEDKMYKQIEKSLSNNMNDRLYVPIEMIDENAFKGQKQRDPAFIENTAVDKYSDGGSGMSRAEYILHAREACLRQMNTFDSSIRISDVNNGVEVPVSYPQGRNKRDSISSLFNNDNQEEDTSEEVASFRSLAIRTVCALVIFLCIFFIDKIKVNWGVFSYETIRQFVTGNNQLRVLEEILVSWLK